MSGNKHQNPNVEYFARANASDIAKQVEENPNAVNQERRTFKCKDCPREFVTFQALGGHRASHRSDSKTTTLENPSEPKLHKCSRCPETFAIGQALGGHMRKHWAEIHEEKQKALCHENKAIVIFSTVMVPYHHPDESCSSSSVTSTSNGKASNNKEVFGYDLNLTPLENELKNGVRSHDHSFPEAS